MTMMIGKIMGEVLSILALSTKEMQERRISEVYFTEVLDIFSDFETEKFVKRLGGRTDVEDALQRLDKLTQEETRTTVAKTWRSHTASKKVRNLLRCSLCPMLMTLLIMLINTRGEVKPCVSLNAFTISYFN